MNKNIFILVFVIMLIVTSCHFLPFLEDESLVHDDISQAVSLVDGVGGVEQIENQHSIKELRVELLKRESIEGSLGISLGSIDERVTNLEQTISELSN